ncbi:hypothetical protein I3842_02G069700 [Carya illinoinensis]|uniref:RNase H type-1 domain-containing protein n=1 Tax=Carya illinoinensis TaxID=32201 RepID=A0A922JZT8_CARIL|nr:hypothetical protein I3842_02G069700 [Carya illinoinensis]
MKAINYIFRIYLSIQIGDGELQSYFLVVFVRDLSWKPPPEGKFKLNFCGALIRSSSTAGIGDILRDVKGDIIMAMRRKEVGVFEVDDIEALAALRELQLIFRLGISSLQGPIIVEIQHLLQSFDDYAVFHVGCQGNEAADLLACHAQLVENIVQW